MRWISPRTVVVGALSLFLLGGCSFGSSPAENYRSEVNEICRSRAPDALARLRSVDVPSDLQRHHEALVRAAENLRRWGEKQRLAALAYDRIVLGPAGVVRVHVDVKKERWAFNRASRAERQALAAARRVKRIAKDLGLNDCAGRA